MTNTQIRCLFLDLGGVILTNGWDHTLRKQTSEKFGFDFAEFTPRHELVFDLFERGKMSFDEYLHWTIFYDKRPFSLEQVKSFILNKAKALVEMIEFIKEVKSHFGLKIVAVSNEGREIATDRIDRFDLRSFIDFFVISGFVHMRKPDLEIYKLAMNLAALSPNEICYIDDRALLTEAAKGLQLHCITHESVKATKGKLELLFSSKPLARGRRA